MALPTRMQALIRNDQPADTDRPSRALELADCPVPDPGRGQVLVEMEASGCNPADLAALAGTYAVSQRPGEICGFEGCGRVVAAGPGLLGRYLKGKRVACVTQGPNGLWAEYAAVPAQMCLPVGETLPMPAAAAFFVNPMTSWVFAEMIRRAGARAVVLSAGASQVSRGVLALCRTRGVQIVLIVRRNSQIDELKAAGAAEVLDLGAAGFAEALRDVCARLQPSLYFDATGGVLTEAVMQALPPGAETIVYGGLAATGAGSVTASIPSLLFRDQRVRGFWLPPYLRRTPLPKMLRIAADVRRLFLDGTFATRVAGTSRLQDFPAALDAYVADMSAGKRFAVMRP